MYRRVSVALVRKWLELNIVEAYKNLAHVTRSKGLHIDHSYVVLLWLWSVSFFEALDIELTICNRTSPASNASPSCFVQRVTVPSVMKGDRAGIIMPWFFNALCNPSEQTVSSTA